MNIPSADDHWAISLGESLSIWIVQVEADKTYMFAYTGADATPADEQAVIDSISFFDTLPTP